MSPAMPATDPVMVPPGRGHLVTGVLLALGLVAGAVAASGFMTWNNADRRRIDYDEGRRPEESSPALCSCVFFPRLPDL